MEQKKLYVSEIAKKFDLSENSIRFYEKKGLIPHMQRDQNNYRFVYEKDIYWFDVVICLKKTGMSISDIKKYIELALKGDTTMRLRMEMIVKQKEVVKKEIDFLAKQLEFLDYKIGYYKDKIQKN
ncbi:MerR family transcriptional regulator [Spiroplasma helicoides]|uniref:MerR family transcriptional regulator n=1 Tax=Spiroplasma helicoides TaxID=216938 RepID=A0A1B3SLM8_9MOLU|nr:MerR family transcriptional regulator [Spiroplasma helicoides]AOG60839.1 MerR family transcriptional regulator [Spiroplasma helicoides]